MFMILGMISHSWAEANEPIRYERRSCLVTINDASLIKKDGIPGDLTTDASLNTILQRHGVLAIRQAYPFAKTHSLLKYIRLL